MTITVWGPTTRDSLQGRPSPIFNCIGFNRGPPARIPASIPINTAPPSCRTIKHTMSRTRLKLRVISCKKIRHFTVKSSLRLDSAIWRTPTWDLTAGSQLISNKALIKILKPLRKCHDPVNLFSFSITSSTKATPNFKKQPSPVSTKIKSKGNPHRTLCPQPAPRKWIPLKEWRWGKAVLSPLRVGSGRR